MIQTQVSTKFQVVIPKEVRNKLKITVGQKFNVYSVDDQIILTPDRNWPEDYLSDLRGLWKEADIKQFINKERDSWEKE